MYYQYKITQCNIVNVNLSNSKLGKLQLAAKNVEKEILRPSSYEYQH